MGNSLTLGSEIDRQKRTLTTSNTSSVYEKISFYEALNTRFKGSIYHPNLIELDSELEIIPEQTREKSQSAQDKRLKNNLLSAYRFNSTFLKEKPYNLSLFANRRRRERNSDIFERQISDFSNYGSNIRYQNDIMPMSAVYRHDDQEIESTLRPLQHYIDDTFTYRANAPFRVLGKTHFDYELHQFLFEEEDTNVNEGTSHTFNLNALRYFDEAKRKKLSSRLRYYDLTGDQDINRLSLDEQFTIKHTSDLQSYYQYGLNNYDFIDNHSLEQYVGAGLSHQLYDSLWSTLDLRETITDSTDYDESRGEISMNEHYKKSIGPAIFQLDLGADYENDQRDIHQETLSIFHEPHTLSDTSITFLNETGVDPTSIVVTNQQGMILIRDRDYIATDLNGKVEIRRIPGSRISNHEEIFVDYRVRTPTSDFSLLRKGVNASIDFWNSLIKFYYRLNNQDYIEAHGVGTFVPDDFDDSIYGMENHYRFLTSRIEYEDYDSTLYPYQAFRIYEDIVWNVSPRSRLGAGGTYEAVDYTKRDLRESYSVRSGYYWNLTSLTSINIEGAYRWEKGLDIHLTETIAKVSFHTKIRKLECEIFYEFDNGTFNNTDFQDHYGIMKVKRTF